MHLPTLLHKLYTLIPLERAPSGQISVKIMLHIIRQVLALIQARVRAVVQNIVVAVVPAQQVLYIEALDLGILIAAVVSPAHYTMILERAPSGQIIRVEILMLVIIRQMPPLIQLHVVL